MKTRVTPAEDGSFVIANADAPMFLTARVSPGEDRVSIGIFAAGEMATVFATYPLSFLQTVVEEALIQEDLKNRRAEAEGARDDHEQKDSRPNP